MPLRFRVRGGRPLRGTVRPAGNKNAALPILAATLMADGVVELDNVPRIRDVETMLALLADLGATAEWTGPNAVRLDTAGARLKPLDVRSEEHTSELQSRPHLVCRLLLEKK